MKTLFIQSKNDEIISYQEILVDSIIQINSPFVNVTNHINSTDSNILLNIEHQHLNTTLDLTQVYQYILLFFSDDLNFKGATYSNGNGRGAFTTQTQYKTILLLKLPFDFNLNYIIKLIF